MRRNYLIGGVPVMKHRSTLVESLLTIEEAMLPSRQQFSSAAAEVNKLTTYQSLAVDDLAENLAAPKGHPHARTEEDGVRSALMAIDEIRDRYERIRSYAYRLLRSAGKQRRIPRPTFWA